VLLAKNRTGYRNLIKLSSIGFLEGYYRRPRIDREALEQHKEGLIGLAACLSGEIALYLRQGNEEAAKASARYFAQLFGKDGYWPTPHAWPSCASSTSRSATSCRSIPAPRNSRATTTCSCTSRGPGRGSATATRCPARWSSVSPTSSTSFSAPDTPAISSSCTT